jgi:hypothetical protein
MLGVILKMFEVGKTGRPSDLYFVLQVRLAKYVMCDPGPFENCIGM